MMKHVNYIVLDQEQVVDEHGHECYEDPHNKKQLLACFQKIDPCI
jgi:hypothetical protein